MKLVSPVPLETHKRCRTHFPCVDNELGDFGVSGKYGLQGEWPEVVRCAEEGSDGGEKEGDGWEITILSLHLF
jgi:hypothetical protein